jgi:hypothetical protein
MAESLQLLPEKCPLCADVLAETGSITTAPARGDVIVRRLYVD